MSSTRSVKSPGVFAVDASTVIPPTPIAGVSYRDAINGAVNTPDGWPYAERVNSAEFNEIMFRYSSLLTILDKQGILGWTNIVDYAVPSITFGSDGKVYVALQASGPTTAVKDPVSEPTYWQEFGASQSAAVVGAFSNLKASSTGLSALVNVTADQIIVQGSAGYKTLTGVNVSASLAASGANGLDAGTSTANTWYAFFVIWNPATLAVAGIFSLSATAPTMPTGYTHKARVGWVRSDATANKYPLSFLQTGRRVRYKVAAGSNVTGLPSMVSGVQGNAATPTYVAVSVSAFVPPSAASISFSLFNGGSTGALATAAPNNSYGSYTSTSNPPPYMNAQGTGAAAQPSVPSEFVLESANIYVTINAGSLGFNCLGWEDSL